MPEALRITPREGAVRIDVVAKPRSGRSGIGGVRDGALVVALRAPPAEGAANDELVRVLAKVCGVRRADVAIVVGGSSRRKVVEIRGLDARAAAEALAC